MHLKSKILYYILGVLLTGCFAQGPDIRQTSQNSLDNSDEPLSVDVSRIENDGFRLFATLEVQARHNFNPELVLIRLSGLSGGIVVSENVQVLSDLLTSSGLASDQAKLVSVCNPCELVMSISSAKVESYNVEVAWGKDAQPLLGRALAAQLVLADARIEKQHANDNSKSDCGERVECNYTPSFKIHSSISNRGKRAVSGAKIDWACRIRNLQESAPDGAAGGVKNTEFSLRMEGLNIMPGFERPVRFMVDLSDITEFGESGSSAWAKVDAADVSCSGKISEAWMLEPGEIAKASAKEKGIN